MLTEGRCLGPPFTSVHRACKKHAALLTASDMDKTIFPAIDVAFDKATGNTGTRCF